jgi:tetratricopeptide (TPR) repeat protein
MGRVGRDVIAQVMLDILIKSRPGRCQLLILVAGSLLWVCLMVAPAHAAKMRFGTQEHIAKIQDTNIKGPKGEDLFLAHKYSFHSFIAPYQITDDGYVLGVKGSAISYYKLDDAQIKSLQARELLPSPLPAYEISALDYALGYLLWGALAFIVIAGAIGLLARKRQSRALPHLNEALAFHHAGDLDGAIEGYTRALEIDRKLAAAYGLRGKAFEAKGEDGKAVSDYTKAINIAPKLVQPLVDRGTAMERQGRYDLAIADFTGVIKLAKGDGAAYMQRARVYLRKGEFDRAITDLNKAIKLAPDLADAYRFRSFAYLKTGQNDLAYADQAKANAIMGDRAPPVPA